MNWFKDHSYVATWLSPCIALVLAIIKGKGNINNVNVRDFVIYAVLFICL